MLILTPERIKSDSKLVAQAAKSITPKILGKIIDLTVLNPAATVLDIEKLCIEANEIESFVCVYGSRVLDVYKSASRFNLKRIRGIVSVIGFPSGAQTTLAKTAEVQDVFGTGADEIDMVLNVGKFLDGNGFYVYDDIYAVASVLKAARANECSAPVLKVIQENCLLTDEQKRMAARITAEVAKETEVRMFAKTSTGFGKPKDWNTPVGATVEDVWLMHEEIKPLQEQGVVIGIKAAGGIKDARSVIQMMLAAGCFNDDLTLKKIFLDLFRVGASAGKAIIEDFRKNFMS